MAKSIETKDLINKKRLASLEVLLYNHIGSKEKSVEEIHAAFTGLASIETIKGIAGASHFMEIEEDKVKTLGDSHMAEVTYDFNPQNEGTELFLSGLSSENGINKTQKKVPLSIGSYAIEIHIVSEGVGNWTLDIKKIYVTTGFAHERKIEENYPKKGNSGLKKTYKTNTV